MSYGDFLHSLSPYNYHVPKVFKNYFSKYTGVVEKILHIADVDKNGQINFCEFFFFVLMMNTSDRSIRAVFKKTGGKMNMKQFSDYLTKERKASKFGKKIDMLASTEDEFVTTNLTMTKNIFAGKSEITEQDFIHVKNIINELLWHYEFH